MAGIVEFGHIKEKMRLYEAKIGELELASLRLRAQARALEDQAEAVDVEASAYLTARNALAQVVDEQEKRDAAPQDAE